ncbi:MAG: M15 family metallopeptidase [Acidobacteriota bacterium]|nr:M15 family metallopeptidase [Acidobacteriota bacterium]
MQNWKTYFLPVAAAVGVLFVVAFLYWYSVSPGLSVYAQRVVVTSDLKPAAAPLANEKEAASGDNQPKPLLVVAPVSVSGLKTAAAENSRLRYNLRWTFGGKSQFGWFIYVPLIQQTTGAAQGAETPEFAGAVAVWQQQFGLSTTGKMDAETLYKMVEWWQSRRLNDSTYPSPNQLLTAPIADFYDPTRSIGLLKVERETYAAYKRMVAAAAKDPTLNLKTTKTGELASDEKFLKIVSAFRSREYQALLRKQSPNSGRAGLATNSPHFTGHALDIYVGGEPVITKDINRALQAQTPVYKWLVKNAEKFGFYPYYYEPWHWEYVPNRLKTYTQPAN